VAGYRVYKNEKHLHFKWRKRGAKVPPPRLVDITKSHVSKRVEFAQPTVRLSYLSLYHIFCLDFSSNPLINECKQGSSKICETPYWCSNM